MFLAHSDMFIIAHKDDSKLQCLLDNLRTVMSALRMGRNSKTARISSAPSSSAALEILHNSVRMCMRHLRTVPTQYSMFSIVNQ